jgi:hypothetical protein
MVPSWEIKKKCLQRSRFYKDFMVGFEPTPSNFFNHPNQLLNQLVFKQGQPNIHKSSTKISMMDTPPKVP